MMNQGPQGGLWSCAHFVLIGFFFLVLLHRTNWNGGWDSIGKIERKRSLISPLLLRFCVACVALNARYLSVEKPFFAR